MKVRTIITVAGNVEWAWRLETHAVDGTPRRPGEWFVEIAAFGRDGRYSWPAKPLGSGAFFPTCKRIAWEACKIIHGEDASKQPPDIYEDIVQLLVCHGAL